MPRRHPPRPATLPTRYRHDPESPACPVSDLVDYAAVTPAHIVPAVEELLGIARQAVEHAADPSLPATWEAVAEPLDTASERLWRWSVAAT